MAFAFVSAVTSTAVQASPESITKSVTANNLLIVGFVTSDNLASPTISDGVNTWTQLGTTMNDGTNFNALIWWYAVAATTASLTVTITYTGNSEQLFFAEWSGNATSGVTDGNAQKSSFANGSGSTATDGDTSTAFTTTANGDLIVSWIVNTQGSANPNPWAAAGTNFTKRATASNDAATGTIWDVEDRVQATSGSNSGTWTAANTDAYGCFAAGFKVATAAGSVVTPRLLTLLGVGS